MATVVSACALLGMPGTGEVRAQDTEQAEVRIVKGEAIRVSNVNDILIGVFGPGDTVVSRQYRTDQFDYQCVYTSTGGYRLNVSSQNGSARMRLRNDAGDTMRYELHLWFRRAGSSFQYTSTRYTRAPIDLSGLSGSLSPTCEGEDLPNSNLIVTGLVQPNDFNRAPPGIYRDVITITVSPE